MKVRIEVACRIERDIPDEWLEDDFHSDLIVSSHKVLNEKGWDGIEDTTSPIFEEEYPGEFKRGFLWVECVRDCWNRIVADRYDK